MSIVAKLILVGVFFFAMRVPARIIAIYERKYHDED